MNEDEQVAGHIVVAAGRIEQMLRAAGATGAAGLHEAATALGCKLSRACVAKIRFVASVRNSVAHGGTPDPSLDLSEFDAACEFIARELAPMLPPDTSKIDEADAEMAAVFRRRLRLCGVFPLANSVYFAALVLRALFPAAAPLALLAFCFTGTVLLIAGALEGDRAKLLVGGIFFSLYWVATMGYRVTAARAGFTGSLRSVLIPGWSVIYLLRALRFFTNASALLTGILPLALNAAAVWLLCTGYDRQTLIYSGACAGAAWLFGLAALLFRRKSFF